MDTVCWVRTGGKQGDERHHRHADKEVKTQKSLQFPTEEHLPTKDIITDGRQEAQDQWHS